MTKLSLRTSSVRALILTLALGFAGCAALNSDPVTVAEMHSADFGEYPENYQTLVKDYLHKKLIDPNSMMIEFDGVPFPGRSFADVYVPRGEAFGYGVRYRINAKNTFGGYTGWQEWIAYIRNGTVYTTSEFFGYDGWCLVKPYGLLKPRDAKK